MCIREGLYIYGKADEGHDMEVYYRINGSRYTLGNNYIERTWEYNGRFLYTVSLTDRGNGRQWAGTGHASMDFCFEGLTCFYGRLDKVYDMQLKDVQVNEIADSIYCLDGIEMTFYLEDKLHGAEYRLHAIVYAGAPAVRTYLEVRSSNLPMGEFFDRSRFNAIDSYALPVACGELRSYEFFTRTDHTNELVREYRRPAGFDRGNLLFYQGEADNGFFILKESPCFSDERPETEGNFHITEDLVQTLGWGIRPEEIPQAEFLKTYSSVIGLYSGGFYDSLLALRKYQECRAAMNPDKDSIIMVNPWGDRQCYEHMSEDFIIRELEAASKLGATHYQLDDGWQKGKGLIQLVYNIALEEDYWKIDKQRFPNDFNRIAQVSRELGVELALWFAPDFNHLFRNYREQAELLYHMYKNYGIRRFKIDAVKLRSKEAENNLEKMLKELRDRTEGDISFNLDTTADPRSGYFMFQEYGNIFLENRYTDWGNYYPWLTLKNFWDLCRFVPPQRLQLEFLNINRCQDKYDSSDVLAPANYSPEYVFAITMFASPLCWFESSALDKDLAQAYSGIISLYKKYQKDIYKGCILPIGDRPDGYSWTGFISHRQENMSGYLIIFKELNDTAEYYFDIPFFKSKTVKLECIMNGCGTIDTSTCNTANIGTCGLTNSNIVNNATVILQNSDGRFKAALENKNDFRLYKYELS